MARRKQTPAEIAAKRADLTGLRAEYKDESDRAAAVVAAAFLDEQIKEYIKQFLVDDEKVVNNLFAPDRPLGAFGARIHKSLRCGVVCRLKSVYYRRNRACAQYTTGLFSMSMNSPRLLDQVRAVLRRKHYSLRTEEAYVGWIKRYVLFHEMRHPRELGLPEGESMPRAHTRRVV